ncbi:MAG: EF-hand domain-containing protein [Burkholderiales bacterium]
MNRTLAMAIALAFASTAAFAEDKAVPSAEHAVPGAEKSSPDAIGHSSTQFESLDSDKDGFLSETEAQDNSSINFEELDADKDGKLSMQEVAAAEGKSGSGAAGPVGDTMEKPSATPPASSGESSSGGSSGSGAQKY